MGGFRVVYEMHEDLILAIILTIDRRSEDTHLI